MSVAHHSMLGTVVRKWQGQDAGHYVIRGVDGEFDGHYSDIFTEAFRHLEVGDRVRFRAAQTESGAKATYIVRLPDDDEGWLDGCGI